MGIQNFIISENRHGLVWLIKQKRKTKSYRRLSISRWWLPNSKQCELKCARKTTSSTTNVANRSTSCIWSCTSISTTLSYATTTTATIPATLSTTAVSATTISTTNLSATTLPNSAKFNKCATNSTERHSSLSSDLSTSTGSASSI